jgi:hypothetical protein
MSKLAKTPKPCTRRSPSTAGESGVLAPVKCGNCSGLGFVDETELRFPCTSA